MNQDPVLKPNQLKAMLITLQEVGAHEYPGPRSGSRLRKRLAPSEKYEVHVQILTGQATQREAAEKWGVDRSTVIAICRTAMQGALDALAAAVPGRHGMSAEGCGAGRGKSGDRTAAGHGDRAGFATASAPGKIGMGLMAGLVPARVDADLKAGLLELVAYAIGGGGLRTLRRAAATLGLDHARVLPWQARACPGSLAGQQTRSGRGVACVAAVGTRRDPQGRRRVAAGRPFASQTRAPWLIGQTGGRPGL
jgi:hypothetical protein